MHFPGNEYADILCLTNLQCLKERRDSLCKKYFKKIIETSHRLNYLLPYQTCNKYGVRRFNKYTLPEIRTNRYRNSLIPWGLYHWQYNSVKTTMYNVRIVLGLLTKEVLFVGPRYHVACHVASRLYCLVFYMLVFIVWVNPTRSSCK